MADPNTKLLEFAVEKLEALNKKMESKNKEDKEKQAEDNQERREAARQRIAELVNNNAVFKSVVQGFNGIQKSFKQFSMSLKAGFDSLLSKTREVAGSGFDILKRFAFVAGLGAVLAFLESPYFKQLKDYVANTIIPALIDFYDNALKPAFDKFIAFVVPIIKDLFNFFTEEILPVIKSLVTFLYNNILPIIGDVLMKQIEAFKQIWMDITGGIKKLLGGDILGGITDIFLGIGSFFANTVDNLTTGIYNIIAATFGLRPTDSVFGSIKNFFVGLYNDITQFFVDMYDAAVDVFISVKNEIVNFFTGLYADIKATVGDMQLFKLVDEVLGDLFGSIKAIFSGDFSVETFTKLFGSLFDIVFYGVNLAINLVRDLFGFSDEDTPPFKLSEFLVQLVDDLVLAVQGIFPTFEEIKKMIPTPGQILDDITSFIFGNDEPEEIVPAGGKKTVVAVDPATGETMTVTNQVNPELQSMVRNASNTRAIADAGNMNSMIGPPAPVVIASNSQVSSTTNQSTNIRPIVDQNPYLGSIAMAP